MKDGFTVDLREFNQAMKMVLDVTRKDAPAYLNKKALMLIIGGKGVKGVMKLTPRASVSAIRSLPDDLLARVILSRAKKTGVKFTRKELSKAIRRERSRRAASAGYTAGPGWHLAAVALGGRGVKLKKDFQRSGAAQGHGKKATPSRVIAEIVNTAPAASKVGAKPLQQAVNNVAADMRKYGADQLLKKTLAKASPK